MTAEGASSRQARLLVVEDDARLRELLRGYLTREGFSVAAVADGSFMDRILGREAFDLLILDLTLPDEDGLSICRRLRAAEDRIPILMLTARGAETDRILGLETGADDYLPKPFNPRELAARARALLRRTQAPPGTRPAEEVVRFGPCRLDLIRRALRRNGEAVPLTHGEFELLRALAAAPERPMSREELARVVQGRERDGSGRSIDVLVSRLRRLVEADPARPRHIQTVWGFGYVFVPGEEAP